MGSTKAKLKAGETTYGGWLMIGHPVIAELMAGEGFDWIAVDMEHTTIDVDCFQRLCMATKGSGVDMLARLSSCDVVEAKKILDAGADGVIVPSINRPEQARLAVEMTRYPPEGCLGAAFCRHADYGRDFDGHFARHNEETLVAIMLEHREAVANADAILATPGVDAAFIGPYDLSTSMELPGRLDHPDVLAAQATILEACRRHGVPPGVHLVDVAPEKVAGRRDDGYRFIACGIDTNYIIHGCREVLKDVKQS